MIRACTAARALGARLALRCVLLTLALPIAAASAQSSDDALLEALKVADGTEAAEAAAQRCQPPGRTIGALRARLDAVPRWPEGWIALGALADRVGDYAMGVAAGTRAVAEFEAKGRIVEAARAEHRLSMRHLRFGRTEARRTALQRCLALRARAGLDTSEVEEELRSLEHRLAGEPDEDPGRLLQRADQARAESRPAIESRALINLAYSLYENRDFRGGLNAMRRALALEPRLDERPEYYANVRNGAGRLALELALTLGEPERAALLVEARDWGHAALAIHEKAEPPFPMGLVWDHCLLAHVCIAACDDAGAEKHFEAEERSTLAIARTTEGERDRAIRTFTAERNHTFEDHALHVASRRTPTTADLVRALEISERGRIGTVRDMLSLRGLTRPQWERTTVPVPEIVERARASNAAVLVYLRGSHACGVIRIDGRGLAYRSLPSPRELDALAGTFTDTVLAVSSKPEAIEREATAAWRAFVEPVFGDAALPKRIVIVGLSARGDLPFAAMATPGTTPISERFIGCRATIAHAPLLAALVADAPPASGPPLYVGCDGTGAYASEVLAHYGANELKPLRNAEREARELATLLPGRVLTGPAATESAVRTAAESASVVTIAAHALADAVDGSRTALLLSPEAGRSDGFLSLADLAEMRLGARLVVLDGCRTASGRVIEGEGIRGLARAVLASGARNLLATIAPIDDAVTPELVKFTLEELRDGRSVPDAVTAARRRFVARPRTSHPALWAPFVLHGQSDLLR